MRCAEIRRVGAAHRPLTALVVAGLFLLALGGCAGSGMPAAPRGPASTERANTAVRNATVRVRLVIHIPRKRVGRNPNYVSPSTKAVGITVDPGPNQITRNADLTPGSPGCTTSSCTVMVSIAPGRHTLDVRTYDAPLKKGVPQGNVLSQNLGFPFTVRAGEANRIGIVLEGVPAGLLVTQLSDEDVTGSQELGFQLYGELKPDGLTAYPRTFVVFPLDADGNVIVGPGAPVLAMSSAKTGTLSNGVVSRTNPNWFTVTPVSYDLASVPFTVTATPNGAPGISVAVNLQMVVRIAPRVYVTDQSTPPNGKVWVFDERGKPVGNVQTILDTYNFDGPLGIAYCADSETLYVVGEFSQDIYQIATTGTLLSVTPDAGYTPLSAYCDTDNFTLYVGNVNAPVTGWNVQFGNVPTQRGFSGNWKEIGSRAVPVNPWAIFVNRFGINVTDAPNKVLTTYDTEGNVTSEGGFSDSPYGMVGIPGVDGYYVTERDANAVLAFVGGNFPNVAGPFGITYDAANGSLYIANYYYSYSSATGPVTRYDTDGNQIALPNGAFAGPQFPDDVEVAL